MGVSAAALGLGLQGAGIAGGLLGGQNPNAAFRKTAVGRFSGQNLGPGSRAFFQTQAEQQSRRFVSGPRSGGRGGQAAGSGFQGAPRFSQEQASGINQQIALRNRANPFSFAARRSDLQSQFFGEDIRRANVNRSALDTLLGRQRRQGQSGGSFTGRPQGASSFSTLLRSF